MGTIVLAVERRGEADAVVAALNAAIDVRLIRQLRAQEQRSQITKSRELSTSDPHLVGAEEVLADDERLLAHVLGDVLADPHEHVVVLGLRTEHNIQLRIVATRSKALKPRRQRAE